MKKLLLPLLILFLVNNIFSQDDLEKYNPFKEFDYTPKIATLSQGKYDESFDNDTIVQIGTVLFNTQSKQIVGFIKKDTLYHEATLEPELVSRWLSPDPLESKFPNMSPYNYVENNPVRLIDPDGRAPIDPLVLVEKLSLYAMDGQVTTWEYIKASYYASYSATTHGALDVLGVIPGVGELADGANALIYAFEGNAVDAGISVAAMVPIVGDAGKISKYAVKFGKSVNDMVTAGARTFRSTARAKKYMGMVAKYGQKSADAILDRGKLKNALGIAKGSAQRAHHIIPINLIKSNKNVRKAIDEGFDFNGAINGIAINKKLHTGSHPAYDKTINKIVNDAFSNPDNVGETAKEIMEGVTGSIKNTLEKNTKKVNQSLSTGG